MTATLVDSFEELGSMACDALGAFSDRIRVGAVSATEAARLLRTAARLKNTAAGIELLVTAKAMEAPEFQPSGGDKTEDKLAKATGRSPKAAKKAIEASKAAQDLPVLDDAVRSGELSAEQAAMIAEAAKNDPAAQSDLIAKAKSEDLKGLRDACERTKAASDPDPEGRHRRVHARRRVRHWTDPDGARCGTWAMTPEHSAEVEHVMDAYTEAAFKKARAEGRREPYEAYRADALVAMARAASGAQAGVPAKKELIIRCDRAAFLRGHTHPGEVCEIRGIGPVPVSVAREILDDCFLKALFLDGVDVRLVKHFGRHIPAELRTALRDRDQVCSDPGCNRCRGLEDDHEFPVAQGGETSQANVWGRCKPDHKEKTKTDNQRTRQLKKNRKLPPRPDRPDTRGDPGDDPPPGDDGKNSDLSPLAAPSLFDRIPDDTTWRDRLHRGEPPPDVGPFDDDGLHYR